jgi:ABC-type branched-subunit amino acid transport system ATPase component
MARTFQLIRLFGDVTVAENVLVGGDAHTHATILEAVLRSPRHRREEQEAYQEASDLLEFCGIRNLADEQAMNLSYGDQRRVEIARALATRPRILLLDEPAAGMNPSEKKKVMDLIRKIRDEGITVLLVEHDMSVVMGISDEVLVLDHGEIIARGRPDEVRRDKKVIEAYLGEDVYAAE